MTDPEAVDMVEGREAKTPGLAAPTPKRRTSLELAQQRQAQAEKRVATLKAQGEVRQAPRLLQKRYQDAVKDQDRAAAKDALQDFTESWNKLIDLQLPETDENSQENFAVQDLDAEQ